MTHRGSFQPLLFCDSVILCWDLCVKWVSGTSSPLLLTCTLQDLDVQAIQLQVVDAAPSHSNPPSDHQPPWTTHTSLNDKGSPVLAFLLPGAMGDTTHRAGMTCSSNSSSERLAATRTRNPCLMALPVCRAL